MTSNNAARQLMDINEWIPYQMWWVARNVAAGLRDRYSAEFGLSTPGWRALANIGSRSPLSSKQLGQYIGLDAVQTSRVVDGLVRMRLVTRKADKADRRKVELSLSKKGEEVYAALSALARELEAEMFEKFSASDKREFSRLMTRLKEQFNESESKAASRSV